MHWFYRVWKNRVKGGRDWYDFEWYVLTIYSRLYHLAERTFLFNNEKIEHDAHYSIEGQVGFGRYQSGKK